MPALRRFDTLLLGGLMLAGVACGAVAAEPARVESAMRDAQAWLQRIQEAALRRNYQGTLVVSAAGSVSSSRVAHFVDGSQQWERVEALDGEMREVIRSNEIVHTYWPRQRIVLIEQRDPRASFPVLLSAPDNRIFDWYELRLVGADRVAGHDADVLWLKARDERRFSQRLWAERQSGLLLRAETVAPDGQVLESSAFSQVAIDIRPQLDQMQLALRRIERYRVLRPWTQSAELGGEGWALSATLPPGFRQVSCFKRTLVPSADATTAVLQTIFSDGLTHVSLFIEPFQSDRHQGMLAPAVGATHTVIQRQGGHWITVMGDVPASTLERIAGALVRRGP